MNRYFIFLLFIFVPLFSAFADESRIAGALQDISEEDLVNIPCPAAMTFSLPENNKEMAIIPGGDGRVEKLSFKLSLQQVGVKKKESGKCFYTVITEALSVKNLSGAKIDVVQKESGSDEYATAFRRSDSAGEQVVGLRVPLVQDFYLSFSEIPFEAVYTIKEKPEGGREYILQSNRIVASAKVRKKVVGFDSKTRVPKVRTENYGEATLIVSIGD